MARLVLSLLRQVLPSPTASSVLPEKNRVSSEEPVSSPLIPRATVPASWPWPCHIARVSVSPKEAGGIVYLRV